jgi:hypothetical protein
MKKIKVACEHDQKNAEAESIDGMCCEIEPAWIGGNDLNVTETNLNQGEGLFRVGEFQGQADSVN